MTRRPRRARGLALAGAIAAASGCGAILDLPDELEQGGDAGNPGDGSPGADGTTPGEDGSGGGTDDGAPPGDGGARDGDANASDGGAVLELTFAPLLLPYKGGAPSVATAPVPLPPNVSGAVTVTVDTTAFRVTPTTLPGAPYQVDVAAPASAPGEPPPLRLHFSQNGREIAAGTLPIAVAGKPGTLDPSFNSGKVPTAATTNPRFVLPLSDGRILVDPGTGLQMLNEDGSTDATFHTPAEVAAAVYVSAAALQPDGRIVLAAVTSATQPRTSTLFRIDRSGALDTSFRVAGLQARMSDVLPRADGSIVVVGAPGEIVFDAGYYAAAIAPTGSVQWKRDPTSFSLPPGNGAAHAGALGANDAVYLTGNYYPPDAGDHAMTIRLLADGGIDTSFQANGYIQSTAGWSTVDVAARDAGYTVYGYHRVNAFPSALDRPAAGSNSAQPADLSSAPGDESELYAGLYLGAGLVAGGRLFDTAGDSLTAFFVTRFSTAYAIDTTFGARGAGRLDPTHDGDECDKLAIDRFGRIVAAGVYDHAGVVARFWP